MPRQGDSSLCSERQAGALRFILKFKGFTLIELIITLSVFSILALMSFSSTQLFISTNEEQIIIDEIRTAVQFARSEAYNIGFPVLLSTFNDEADWSNGISISRFNKKLGQFQPVYQHRWHHTHWLIQWSGIKLGNQIHFSNNPMDALSNGHFSIHNPYSKKTTILILNRLGRLRKADTIM